MKTRKTEESPSFAGLIDVHSHIIPKADDGSRYWGETKILLSTAYKQGVRKIIATPHYRHHRNRMSLAQLMEQMSKMHEISAQVAPDLEVYSGQEVFYCEEAVDALDSGRALTLAGTKYVLVEFSPQVSYGEIYQAVRNLVFSGYLPVLAHIERYFCLRLPGKAEELIQAGAYMQMNYSSLSDQKLRHMKDRHWCRKMVLAGNIHFLGTDMHRLDFRPPDVRETVEWLQKKAGLQRLKQLTMENPLQLLAGSKI